MRNIVVIGAGFAGLWSSISAARSLDELHENDVRITVINRDEWHGVRVRYYESELLDARIPLNEILDPIGVELVVGEVEKSTIVATLFRCGRLEVHANYRITD